MSFLENLKRMNKEECPFYNECYKNNFEGNTVGVGCLNLNHKKCLLYIEKNI